MHPQAQKTLKERFWEKVDKGDPGECWEWQATTDTKGYGRISEDGQHVGAHRVSYRIHHEAPGELFVCHHCDNPSCVNPEHLFLGTNADNMRDAYEKGRVTLPEGHPPPRMEGEENPATKLSDEEVREIRRLAEESSLTHYDIADRFGVSQPHIGRIVRGERRKDA